MEKMVTISEKEYWELQEANKELDVLYAVGVDNWEGYEEAMNILRNNYDEGS